MESKQVLVWWATLSVVALVNLALWAKAARSVLGEREPDAWLGRYRRRQLLLSLLFVLGCATRSWTIRADVQRFCMIDSFVGSVFVGRSIATVAELSFVAQWALLVDALGAQCGNLVVRRLARTFVPTIAVAETCSWYAVLTTNYAGNALEESLWTFTAALTTVCLALLLPSGDRARRRFLGAGLLVGTLYVAFMTTVDVPMYWTRWHADQAAGRAYLSLGEGLRDAMTWRVTLRWEDWREEVPWMSLYFSAATWISLLLVREPALALGRATAEREPASIPERVAATPVGLAS